MKNLTVILLILVVSLSSCLTTRTAVGNYASTQGTPYTYAKGKQIWIFGGLIPVGRTSVATPPDGNCQVITKFSFGDVLVSTLSLGLVTTYTIKVRAKRGYGGNNAPNAPTQSNPTPANTQSNTPTNDDSSTPVTPLPQGTGDLQVGEVVYMKNSMGNTFAVTIAAIDGNYAIVSYENALGAEKSKRVALGELMRRP